MKKTPIIMTGESVRGINGDRKTQTRRVIKGFDIEGPNNPNKSIFDVNKNGKWVAAFGDDGHGNFEQFCPYGKKGDRLWVREAWRPHDPELFDVKPSEIPDLVPMVDCISVLYKSDLDGMKSFESSNVAKDIKWKSSMFMPRWASRIDLELTEVRIERVQDISKEDAVAEGLYEWINEKNGLTYYGQQLADVWELDPRVTYKRLWNEINGRPRKDGIDISWTANPWVWVLGFKEIEVDKD